MRSLLTRTPRTNTLREGVRYNGKLLQGCISHFIRQQDIIYIWQLGKKRKKQLFITERARHRLNNATASKAAGER
jgi:hypothetical protein